MAEKNYKELARKCRLKVLSMIHNAGTSHIASNFSIIDVATVLYKNLKKEDKVVWSKGWVAATIYYFLAQQGTIPEEDLDKFGKEIDGHIPYLGLVETTTPGIYANAGSMGHGLPIACGMALAKKLKGEPGNIYCIISDGEMNEGTCWEAAMFAKHNRLNNLIVFVDANKWQAMGKTSEVLDLESIENIWQGFGWKVARIDGHDFDQIEASLTEDFDFHIDMHLANHAQLTNPVEMNVKDKPLVIICDTIKGKGVSFMEDHLLYHYKHVSTEDYELAKEELCK